MNQMVLFSVFANDHCTSLSGKPTEETIGVSNGIIWMVAGWTFTDQLRCVTTTFAEFCRAWHIASFCIIICWLLMPFEPNPDLHWGNSWSSLELSNQACCNWPFFKPRIEDLMGAVFCVQWICSLWSLSSFVLLDLVCCADIHLCWMLAWQQKVNWAGVLACLRDIECTQCGYESRQNGLAEICGTVG